jgi:hypothetical protein
LISSLKNKHMSPTMPHIARLFISFILVCIASAGPVHAASETVTLENGQTYEVETDKRGEPVRAKNRQVQMTLLDPDVTKSTSSESPVYAWKWSARIKAKGTYKVTVTTPIDDAVSTSFEVVGRSDVEREFFNSEEYPTLWAWLNDSETTWIPIVFSFEDTKSGKSFELTQWKLFDGPFKKAVVKAAYAATGLVVTESDQSASANETALINIFRQPGRPKKDFDLFMDGMPIVSLPPGSYTRVAAAPGWHVISGEVPTEWFEFRSGREYFFRIVDSGAYHVLMVEDLPDIEQVASSLGLAYVEPSQDSLLEFRDFLDSYSEVRQHAAYYGLPIRASYLTYKDEEPGLLSDYRPLKILGGKEILTVSDTAISFETKKINLNIPMSDIHSVGLYTAPALQYWIEVAYSEEGALRNAYFGGVQFSLPFYNRTMLAYQNSRSQRTEEEALLLPLLEGNWELGYSSEDDTEWIYEYVRPGQTVENWMELATVQNDA